ncbi:hypothetical protein ACJX0J_000222 [Zea mays]
MIGRKAAISRAQLDALSPFNPLSEIRVALWRAHSIYDFAFMDNESNLPKDVIYSLSLSIYGKNCTHAMIFKSFLLKWNSDFRTISYKRMKKILLIFLFLKIFDPSPRRRRELRIFIFYESLLSVSLLNSLFLILYLYPIEEIKEVEKFVLLNFKGLRRLLGKRQRLLAYLAKKIEYLYIFFFTSSKKPKIAKLTEEIALNFPGTSLLKELATLIIWLTPIFYYLFTPLSKWIPMDPMNKVKSSNIRRGNSIPQRGVLKDPILFLVLAGIFGIFCEKKETPLFIVDKTKSLLTPLDILFPHKDIEYNEPSLDFIFGPEASKSVPHKKVVL